MAWVLILVFWQMPHFYAIAIYRGRDYAEAKLPVAPNVSGIFRAKIEMILYVLLFALATLFLSQYAIVSILYMATMSAVAMVWLSFALYGLALPRSRDSWWARKMFFISLLANLAFCVALIIG